LAFVLTLAALLTPTAQANHGRDADVRQPPTRIVTVETGGGFDWGGASIGGAGLLGVVLLAGGVGLLVVRRSHAAAGRRAFPGRSRRAAVEGAPMRRRLGLAIAASAFAAVGLAHAAAADRPQPDPNVAGLQTALAVKGFYHGAIDGIRGPRTTAAIKAFQQSGRALSALGMLGRPRYGTRALRRGMVGLDVSALQFELRFHGFPNDERSRFGPHTQLALERFQAYAGLKADGVAGRATYVALEKPPPAAPRLRSPLAVVQRIVPVGNALELSCPYATPVAAAAGGTVVFATNRPRGYGYTVVTRDAKGFEILYAHLARIDVRNGQRLIPGAMVGLAGWTGKSKARTSLRVELRLRGAQLPASDSFR
jgi:murein DD-endopeptidase MepM/ murein hydrolase activator NlpD